MARIIRLTERDLSNIVRRVIKEQDENNSKMYIVNSGDNLTMIAKKYNMTVSDILKLNPQIKDANKIYPGDGITIQKMGREDVFRAIDKLLNPDCRKLLVQKEVQSDYERIKQTIGDSNYMDLEITGNIEISYNATISPNNRAVTVIKNGRPFCHIPVYDNIGDCKDEMELRSDELGAPMSASLVSPVSINTTGTVAPKDSGLVIKDGNGYFCKVPIDQMGF